MTSREVKSYATEMYVVNGIAEENTASIIEREGEIWVQDPWEGRLHPIASTHTTPNGIRLIEAFYTGSLGCEESGDATIHMIIVQHVS